jgi:hypothetical protein
MTQLMYFKGNAVYFNNICLSLLAMTFVLYGLIKAEKFARFYKTRFYIVFCLHFCALSLNATHALILQHQATNATVMTESCLALLLVCFFFSATFWTYRYYLRFVYSLVTQTHFKTFTRLLRPLAFWKSSDRDYYDYDTLLDDSNEDETTTRSTTTPSEQVEEDDAMMEDGWFRYVNYQVLGNYLFAQMFNLYAMSATYGVRTLAIVFGLNATTQLGLVSVAILGFVTGCGFFDFRYRRFTKSLILPHMSMLVLVGYWMLEHYQKFDKKRPEPVSIITFILIFMYVIIKFAFLTETTTIERIKKIK